jgi:probable addiction module antidote protein
MTDVLPRRALGKDASPQEISDFINAAFDGGDVYTICKAIGIATKIHDIKQIAERANIARTSIYRAFSGPKLPRFLTVLDVLDAMGLQMKVSVRRKAKRTRVRRGVALGSPSTIETEKATT